jgi:hypothetical protein
LCRRKGQLLSAIGPVTCRNCIGIVIQALRGLAALVGATLYEAMRDARPGLGILPFCPAYNPRRIDAAAYRTALLCRPTDLGIDPLRGRDGNRSFGKGFPFLNADRTCRRLDIVGSRLRPRSRPDRFIRMQVEPEGSIAEIQLIECNLLAGRKEFSAIDLSPAGGLQAEP